jgi:hypothetical protein
MATAHSSLRYSTSEQGLGDSERWQIEKEADARDAALGLTASFDKRIEPLWQTISGSIDAGKTFPDPRALIVHLLWLNIDHFYVARAQAAQLVAYRSRLMLIVEEPSSPVIGRPPAAAAVVPACDRRI